MAVDETAIVTWANMVTVTRVLASPFLFLMIPDERVGSWAALAVWILLCSSDGFDGYLARRHGITRSGAFLDPLADKILVLYRGSVVHEAVGNQVDVEAVGLAMAGLS